MVYFAEETVVGSNEASKIIDLNQETEIEHVCYSMLTCMVTTLLHGLRSGGGIGDVLRQLSFKVHFGKLYSKEGGNSV